MSLIKLYSNDYNIGKSASVQNINSIKNNILELHNNRNFGYCISDSPRQVINDDLIAKVTYYKMYNYYIPYYYPKKLNLLIYGKWMIEPAAPGAGDSAYLYIGTTGNYASVQVPITSTFNLTNDFYQDPIAEKFISIDMSSLTTGFAEIKFVLYSDQNNYAGANFPVILNILGWWESDSSDSVNKISYNFNDVNQVGSIHDTGINAIVNRLEDFYTNHKRIICTWSRCENIITDTSAVTVMEYQIPIMGKKYFSSDTTDTFTVYYHINSITNTSYAALRINNFAGVQQSISSYDSQTTTGWKSFTHSSNAIGEDFAFDKYCNIYAYVSSGGSVDIDGILIYC